jgi:hypothetical protein
MQEKTTMYPPPSHLYRGISISRYARGVEEIQIPRRLECWLTPYAQNADLMTGKGIKMRDAKHLDAQPCLHSLIRVEADSRKGEYFDVADRQPDEEAAGATLLHDQGGRLADA